MNKFPYIAETLWLKMDLPLTRQAADLHKTRTNKGPKTV